MRKILRTQGIALVIVTLLALAFATQSQNLSTERNQNPSTKKGPTFSVDEKRTAGLVELSKKVSAAEPEDRLSIARQGAADLGVTFVEPSSPAGRSMINVFIALRISEVYQSDWTPAEKETEARRWAAEGGATFLPSGSEQADRLTERAERDSFGLQSKKAASHQYGLCLVSAQGPARTLRF